MRISYKKLKILMVENQMKRADLMRCRTHSDTCWKHC